MGELAVAVVGATGVVGRAMVSILEERDFPLTHLRLVASTRSAGTKVNTRWGEQTVEDLDSFDPGGIDIALFSAGADRSRQHAPRFAEAGATVIDNSSAFRKEADVPLVVAQVNDHDISDRTRGIIANPNCTTMILMMAAGPLHQEVGVASLVATSYQSVSGSGRQGVEEMESQTRAALAGGKELTEIGEEDLPPPQVYPHPIGFNVIPLAGTETEQHYTDEEWKLVNETRKILGEQNILVEPTCVRVPVSVGHGIAASFRFNRPLEREEALSILENAPGVEVSRNGVPTPLAAAGRDEVLVGRVRDTVGQPGGINLWVVGDNLRKGAALNTIQIAEQLIG